MRDLVAQASTLVLLASGMWWGYRRWIRPYVPTLDWEGVGLLLLLVLRACLIRGCCGQSSEHQARHGNVNHRFAA